MDQTEFTAAVETDLQLRGCAFDQRELREFLASVWPLFEPGDLPAKWADAFLEVRAQAERKAKLAEAQAIVAQADPELARCAGVEFQAVAAVPLVTK